MRREKDGFLFFRNEERMLWSKDDDEEGEAVEVPLPGLMNNREREEGEEGKHARRRIVDCLVGCCETK
jgi:hypothetical protein